jgi:putative spermidine/putrescine transport system permease protein
MADLPRVPAVLLAAPLLVALALFVVYPLVRLVVASLGSPEGIRIYTEFFRSRANVRALSLTFAYSAVVTVLALIIGAALAWPLRVTHSRMVRLLFWTAVLVPGWMGVVIKNYAFLIILGKNGVLNTTLQALHLTDRPLDILYTPTAVVIGMLYTMLPYAVLPLYVTFLTIDTSLIAAAENLGASWLQAMMSIALPLARVGLLATGVLVFVIALGFYVTPVALGGARATFVATLIQDDLFFRFDDAGAATLGTILVVAVCVILVGASRFLGTRADWMTR